MKLAINSLLLLPLLFFANLVSAQYTETFEAFSAGGTSFTSNSSQAFTITGGYAFYNLSQAGWNGSAKDNVFIDNTTASGPTCIQKLTTSIKTSNGAAFTIKSIYAFTATCANLNQNVTGSMLITGKLGGNPVFSYTKSSGFTTNTSTNNGFTLLDFTNLGDGANNSIKSIDEIEFTVGGSFAYLALDAFRWQSATVPTITTSGSPSAFATCAGTASSSQSFNVSGSNLTANITATAPAGFEVSLSSGSGYGSSVSLTQSSGTVSSTPVYVRLTSSASGAPAGNVSMSTTGGITKDVAVSGTVNALPTFVVGSISSVLTNATSFSLPYNSTTASPNQYSITTGSPTAMGSFTAVSNASLTASPLAVTIPASLGNTYNFNMTMKNSTTGCVSSAVPFTLTVISPSISTSGSLSAFSSCAGTVSAAQSINVAGSNLIANIAVAVPTGFEISTAVGSGYGSSVSLTQSGNAVSSTPVYIRLAASASGAPSGNVAATSTNATTQNIGISGTANALPTITIGTVAGVNTTATSFSIPYSAISGAPTQYSISAGTPAMPSFAAVSNATLPATPIAVTIPASAANTYGFGLTVKNTTTGCVSSNVPISLPVSTPVVTITGSFSSFTTCSGLASTAQSVSVSGSNLGGNVTVTAPTGFEISTTVNSGYSSSVALSPSSGTLSSTDVYVRIAAGTTGTPTGSVSFAAAGTTTQNKAVSGTVNTTPSISNAATASACSGSGPGITLSASAASTYTWTLGTNTGNIAGASASTGSPTTINQSLTNPSATLPGSIVYVVVPTSVSGNCVGSAFNITVTVNPLTVVTADPSPTSACVGGNASFTVSATGANLTYQWQVNQGSSYADLSASAPYSNITQPTMNITSAVVGMNGYTYRCVVGGSCPSATSNGALLTVAHIWTGGTSVSWTTGSNWSCGSAPVASSNVVIPSGTSFSPAITSNVTLNQLTINSGATLSNTGTNRQLTLNGVLTNNGILSIGSNNLVLNGSVSGSGTFTSTTSSTLTIGATVGTVRFTPASNNLFNLVLNDNTSVTLGNALNIMGSSSLGSVSIGLNAVLSTGGFLMLKSNATGTAYIDVVQTGGSITGNVTVERYIPAKTARKWSFLTAPVTGTTVRNAWQQQVFVTGAGTGGAAPCAGTTTGNGSGTDKYNNNGFDISVNNAPTVYSYNGALANGSRWIAIPGTSTALVAGKGYRANIRGTRGTSDANCSDLLNSSNPSAPNAVTLSATGTLRVGDVPVTLDGVAGDYTLLGNPYASSIDFDLLNTDNTSLAGKYWFYSPENAASPTTIYSAYTTGSMTNKPASYTDANSNNIASGQSFFVQKGAAASVTFKEAHKASAPSGSFRTQSYNWNNAIRAGLKDASGTHLDEVLVRFGNVTNVSKNYTDAWDARSINEAAPVIVSLKGTERLAIQTRPLSFFDDTVKLGTTISTVGNYRLAFSEYESFTAAAVIKLRDKFLQVEQDIKANAVYPFSVTTDANSTGDDRFEIVFRSSGALPVNYIGITAKNKGLSDVEVNWQLPSETDVKKYEVERSGNGSSFDLRGTVNSRGNSLAPQSYTYTDIQRLAVTSYYRIKATDKAGVINYSPIVKVSNGKDQLSVAIYPNPVKDKLNMVIQNIDGSYTIKISTMEGKTLLVQSGSTVTGNIVTINTATLAAGIYMVETTDSKGNRLIEKMVKE